MFNNGLPDSSLFYCIWLLCLPYCLSAHMTCTICSSAFYALCAMSIHYTDPLLFNSAAALSSFFTHESPSTVATTSNSNNNHPSSPYHVFMASVHLVHAIFAIPLHAHTTPIPSTSQVLCVIIIMTLQLLWQFNPCVYHHSVLSRDSFFSLAVETLRLLCYSRAHPFCFSYELILFVLVTSSYPAVNFLHESSSFHWQIPCDSSTPLEITPKSLRLL
jgi:hypothetical protein